VLPHSIAPVRLNDLRDPKDVVAGPDNRAGGHFVDERRRGAGRPSASNSTPPGEHLNEDRGGITLIPRR
jgi:hypothetical protein